MTSPSDFEEAVESVKRMLERLDTKEIHCHEIPELEEPTAPEGSAEATATDEASSEEVDTNVATENANIDSDGTESGDDFFQPHQYIIIAETSVGPNFTVRAVEGDAYFDVLANFSLVPAVAKFYDDGDYDHVDVEDLPDDHPLFLNFQQEQLEEMDTDIVSRVVEAVEALNNLDEEIKGEIIYQLTEIFTTASVKYVVHSTRKDGKGGIKGFKVFYRIFPYEDDFNLSTLNDVVERVRMATQRGKIFLKYSFQLDIDFGETTGGAKIEANPPSKSDTWEMRN